MIFRHSTGLRPARYAGTRTAVSIMRGSIVRCPFFAGAMKKLFLLLAVLPAAASTQYATPGTGVK